VRLMQPLKAALYTLGLEIEYLEPKLQRFLRCLAPYMSLNCFEITILYQKAQKNSKKLEEISKYLLKNNKK